LTVNAQWLPVNECMTDRIVCLRSREAHEFGQHGCGGDFDENNMVDADLVKPILDLDDM